MFSLLRYFSITSLIVFAVVAVLLGLVYRRIVLGDLFEMAESKNIALTQSFSNSLWPRFAPFVASTPTLSPPDLKTHPQIAQLHRDVLRQMAGLSVVKVKVYNLEGLTVFSTDPTQIGEDQSDNQGFLTARSGQAASELTHRDTFSGFDGDIEDRDVFSSYIPIRRGGPNEPVEAVFEVYDDVTPLVQRIERSQRNVILGGVSILAILYTTLVLIIKRSTNILQSQYAEHKQTEQALRESEEKFRTLAETTTAAIVIHQGAEFLYVNPATEAITGYSNAELLAMKFWTIVDPMHHHMIRARAAARLHGAAPPSQFELKAAPRDGRECWVYLAAGVIEFEGKPAIIATFFDITRLKQTEESLALARDEALEASRLKTQLLANVSHELRTPLNAILGYAEMLQRDVFGPVSASQSEAVTEIIDSTGQLLNFVNNLLGQAQIEAGKIALNRTWFAPAELLDDTSAVIGALAQTKGVQLLYDITPDMPAELYGDPYWLRQILLNLVNNAVKFTDRGTVSVGLCRPDPDHWCIRVTDTGYGIPPEAQAYIFEAFRQMDGTVTRTHGGSGLGLSIVKQLTTLMDGQIFLESEVGQGSTFTILLPLTVAQKETLVNSKQ